MLSDKVILFRMLAFYLALFIGIPLILESMEITVKNHALKLLLSVKSHNLHIPYHELGQVSITV